MVDPQAVASFIGWHRIVIQRASTLLPAAPAATHISAFFHKKAPDLPPCCLLDQVRPDQGHRCSAQDIMFTDIIWVNSPEYSA